MSNPKRKAKLAEAMGTYDRGAEPTKTASPVRRRFRRPRVAAALALSIVASSAVWLAAFTGLLPAHHPLLSWSMPWRRVTASRLQARAEHRLERLVHFEQQNASLRIARESEGAPAPVVFLGSSTIERLSLDTLFPGRATLNRGVAAASIGQLREELALCLPPIPVAGVVVFAGRVELLESERPVEEICAELRAFLAEVVAASNGAPLCLLGLPPTRTPTARERADLPQFNACLADLAREYGAVFLALDRPPLRDSTGALSESCSSDALHLNDAGEALLAQWLRDEGGDVGRSLAP